MFDGLDYLVRQAAEEPDTRVVEGPSQQNITRFLPGADTSEVAGSRSVMETDERNGEPALSRSSW